MPQLCFLLLLFLLAHINLKLFLLACINKLLQRIIRAFVTGEKSNFRNQGNREVFEDYLVMSS